MVKLLAVVLLAYAGVCVALLVMQRSMIYYPQPRSGGSGAPLITLDAGDARLNVTTRHVDSPEAVLYFGGNAEDVTGSLPDVERAFPGRALYLMHYRGYGGSSGKPTEKALFADAERLFDHAARSHANVTVVGRSLGSGVATYLASVRPVARLVLVTPFESLAGIAKSQFPLFPVGLLMLDKYDSAKYAPEITAPTLLVVAGRDEIIPRTSSESLLRHFRPGVARLSVIEGAGHNDLQLSPSYSRALSGS